MHRRDSGRVLAGQGERRDGEKTCRLQRLSLILSFPFPEPVAPITIKTFGALAERVTRLDQNGTLAVYYLKREYCLNVARDFLAWLITQDQMVANMEAEAAKSECEPALKESAGANEADAAEKDGTEKRGRRKKEPQEEQVS